jgi:hypothetical protein
MKITVFRDLTPCRLVQSYQLFKRACCLSLKGTKVITQATRRHISDDSRSYSILARRSKWGSLKKLMDFSGSKRDEKFVVQLSGCQFVMKDTALKWERYA